MQFVITLEMRWFMLKPRHIVALAVIASAPYVVRQLWKPSAPVAQPPVEATVETRAGGTLATALQRTETAEANRLEARRLEDILGTRCGMELPYADCVSTLQTIASHPSLIDALAVIGRAGVRVNIRDVSFRGTALVGDVSNEGAIQLYAGHTAQEYLAFLAN
jgi:hypothetical protein